MAACENRGQRLPGAGARNIDELFRRMEPTRDMALHHIGKLRNAVDREGVIIGDRELSGGMVFGQKQVAHALGVRTGLVGIGERVQGCGTIVKGV